MKLGVSLPQGLSAASGDLLAAVDALPVDPTHVSVWSSWDNGSDGPPGLAFPTREVKGLTARGIRPIVFWQPAGAASTHASILRGDHDAYITQWARDAGAWGGTAIVRFAWEANGNWRNADGSQGMPWGVFRNGNTAASYISAWRHVVGMVRPLAPNLLWHWCMNVTPWSNIASLWPGTDVVDRAGLDGYAWAEPLKSPGTIFGAALDVIRGFTAKPLIIGEFAAVNGAAGRAVWFKDTVAYLGDQGVTAGLWFNIDTSPSGPDWRMGDGIIAAWKAL